MPRVGVESVVPAFESVTELRAGLDAKARFEPQDLYPRDGSRLLGDIQNHVAYLAGVNPDNLLVFNAGMSAVTDAIDVALHTAETDTPVVACARDTYTQTKRYIDTFIRGKRAQVSYFDSGDPDSVQRMLQDRQPDVIVTETVANYVNVPVLATTDLLQQVKESTKQAVVVLDNTLPLSTGLPLSEILDEQDRVIVTESGTKSYTFNEALLGVGYTLNPGLLDWLRRYRRTRGSLPGPEHLERVSDLLPETRDSFDERNKRLFQNTGDIALRLSQLTPANSPFVIAHPEVPSHDNHDYYKQAYPDGGCPVIYVSSFMHDQYELAERLWAHPEIRSQAKLGQSFGFEHARIVADENIPAIRIAGGSETDGLALGEACAEALYDSEPAC